MLNQRIMLAAVLACFAGAEAVSAQAAASVQSWRFAVEGGAAMPTGNFSTGANTGFNVGGALALSAPGSPLEVRGEAFFSNFGGKTISEFGSQFNAPASRILEVGAAVSSNSDNGPYAIVGAGFYNLSCSGCSSVTKLGLNGGAGWSMTLSGLNTFIEARYHLVMTDGGNTTFVPVSVGIRF